jgi:hypothetical protein
VDTLDRFSEKRVIRGEKNNLMGIFIGVSSIKIPKEISFLDFIDQNITNFVEGSAFFLKAYSSNFSVARLVHPKRNPADVLISRIVF